ncbi:MAG: 3-isopropylmalate dehydratase large subunit [Thermanaerothrix sp.]|nr:3-isopropylmalate dehydratase large subunit [Thermanaerothrix sp.]
MPRTLIQQILARHGGDGEPGSIVEARVDFAFANDITAPPAIEEFRRMGAKRVFDPERCAIVPDHFTPPKDIGSAEQLKACRRFSMEQGMLFFEPGKCGVEHAFLPEEGYVLPGDIAVGADSHTCTMGALGAFGTGMGSTDLAALWALGKTWFKVPHSIKVRLEGTPGPFVSGKDAMLHLIGQLGVDGARYMALEFQGEGVQSLSMDSRFTMANMGIECGAKGALFVPDEAVLRYANGNPKRPFEALYPDKGARYLREIVLPLDRLEPLAACPNLPSNVKPVRELRHVEVHQVFIGSCTNGRMEDLRSAASVLKGRRLAPSVRGVLIPASRRVFSAAMNEELLDVFMDAGFSICTPSCGPCLGGHLGILAKGEVCVSTGNRNFTGRMGHPESLVYLANPAVAAASGVKGRIADPRDLE